MKWVTTVQPCLPKQCNTRWRDPCAGAFDAVAGCWQNQDLALVHGWRYEADCAAGMQDLGRVPGPFIAAALLPALVITLLFFFDHSVSSQMAQQPEFGLEKPSAYHYDFLLLGIMTIACGLIGVPPVNGVLPQVRQPQVPQQ